MTKTAYKPMFESALKGRGDALLTSKSKAKIQQAKEALSVLANKNVQKILSVLHSGGRVSVTDIYIQMRAGQSQTSQYLYKMREIGLVEYERMGKYVIYSINKERLSALLEIVEAITEDIDIGKPCKP